MIDHQKPKESTMGGEDGAANATAALAAAVAKRAQARNLNGLSKGKALHGGKPLANVRMTAQVKGK